MTEKHAVIIAFIVIVACIMLTGYMNAQDIKACEEAGHSKEVCYATFNP